MQDRQFFLNKKTNFLIKNNEEFKIKNQNLNDISIQSFNLFYNVKIKKIFKKAFPFYSKNGLISLSLKKIKVGKSEFTFEEVKNKLGSFQFPVNLTLKLVIDHKQEKINFKIFNTPEEALLKWLEEKILVIKPSLIKVNKEKTEFNFVGFSSDETEKLDIHINITKIISDTLIIDFKIEKEKVIYFNSYPMISEKGTFLINGIEKVVVLQLKRSSGVFFSKTNIIDEFDTFGLEIIPKKGTWININTKIFKSKIKDVKNILNPFLEIILNKVKTHNIAISNLFNILGFEKDYIFNLFGDSELLINSYNEKLYIPKREETIKFIFSKLNNNLSFSLENKHKFILDSFFSKKKFFLDKVGRYKLNDKLFLFNILYKRILAEDLVDSKTNKVLFKKGTLVTKEISNELKDFFLKNDNKIIVLKNNKDFKIPGNKKIQVVKVYKNNYLKDETINLIGIDPQCNDELLNIADFFAMISYLINLEFEVGNLDDIDSLENRNICLIDELLENIFTQSLNKIKDETIKKINNLVIGKYNEKIARLINSGPLINSSREFFNVSQLSQFLDQTNPLTELSNKRRITVLGEGGLKRESASAKVRDVHYSYFGKICPIETPEGPNIGLIVNLSFFAKINEWNFIETPYWKVNDGKLTGEIVYLSAIDESNVLIAPSIVELDENLKIVSKKINIYFKDNLLRVDSNKIEYLGFSSEQMFSISTANIPFLENNEANRALMGANMQKQAVPLINAHSPLVGTGIERLIARDSGFSILSKEEGIVEEVDSEMIKILGKESNKIITYKLYNFLPSNQQTVIFHNVLVKVGEKVKSRQIIADSCAMENGELALGNDILVAFMTWKGYNFEDALIVSDKLVRNDVFTSIHIEEYEIRRLRTKLGDEEFTNEIINASKYSRRLLDENGIALVGSEVFPGDILVGKITPKRKEQKNPEDLLLDQLFKGREYNVENNSLTVPNSVSGTIQKIEIFKEDSFGENITAEVIEIVKVYIARKICLKEGDKMASRHGNKGVISRILPQNSMPYLADGTIIDIMINPLGVISRMNVGQLLEMHLGYAAKKLNIKVAVPVFQGLGLNKIKELMKKAGLDSEGKETLYDGETGEKFDQKIALGYMYYMKLSHMVHTKLHAREVGPYSLIAQQPLKGKTQNGGQRFGEMEVWALESYGASYNLRELLTIKSDDVIGRNRIYRSFINDTEIDYKYDYFPESFNVLVMELKALCLNFEIIYKSKTDDVTNKELIKNNK